MPTTLETVEDAAAFARDATCETLDASGGRRVALRCLRPALARRELLVANGWNPNHAAGDRMALLQESILDNGFCFPIVTIFDADVGRLVIIDGFHRYLIAGPDWLALSHVPVVVLAHDTAKRMTATVQFNKARGVHQLDLDADIVRALIEQGMSDEAVAAKLGLELEAVHRYKQVTGVAALFARAEYSVAWEMAEDDAG